MTIYIEQEDGSLIDEDNRTIPNSTDNRHYRQALQEVIDTVSTITPYAGSQDEIDAAILAKQSGVSQEFQDRHAIDLRTANINKAYYLPSVDPAAVKMDADIAVADVAIIFLGALGDLPTINAYNVAVDPSWTP